MRPHCPALPCSALLLEGRRPEHVPEGRPHLSPTVTAGTPRGGCLAAFRVISIVGCIYRLFGEASAGKVLCGIPVTVRCLGFSSWYRGWHRTCVDLKAAFDPLVCKAQRSPRSTGTGSRTLSGCLRPQIASNPVDAASLHVHTCVSVRCLIQAGKRLTAGTDDKVEQL